jgi:hypothetical protein
MAHGSEVKHDYHLVNPSPWPFTASLSIFLIAIGLITWLRGIVPSAPEGVTPDLITRIFAKGDWIILAVGAAGLIAAPWLLQRLGGAHGSAGGVVLATRAAGALLAVASGWALSRDVLPQVIAYCFG